MAEIYKEININYTKAINLRRNAGRSFPLSVYISVSLSPWQKHKHGSNFTRLLTSVHDSQPRSPLACLPLLVNTYTSKKLISRPRYEPLIIENTSSMYPAHIHRIPLSRLSSSLSH